MSAADEGSEPPRTRRRRRWVIRAVVVVLVAFVGCLALEGLVLVRMRGDLSSGRTSLEDARRSLLAGDVASASADFTTAGQRFGAAAAHGGDPVGALASAVPAFGNTVEVAIALADAGEHLATAGTDLTEALRSTPAGIDALAPRNGRLPLDAYGGLEAGLGSARAEVGLAAGALAEAPTSFVAGTALNALWDAQFATDEVMRAVGAADLLIEGLPAFAGAAGQRHYLVVAQNPAELRGTGGFWGAYAILTFDEGRPSLSATAPIQTLANLPASQVPAPSPDYARTYAEFGGAASWHNLNMTPDFPSAAQAALANYRAGEGEQLDGVIAADPFALRAMLEVTGAVSVPGVSRALNASNVVEFTTNAAYSLFPKSTERKLVLGTVATGVLQRFLDLDGKGLPRLRALGRSAGGGHLLVYSSEPGFEQGLTLAGASGTFADPPGDDIASITVNNASASKVDFYAVRHVTYDVRLGGDHDAAANLTARIGNDAPTEGMPPYVIGPIIDGSHPGDQIPLITGWCHQPCGLIRAERDGHEVGVAAGSERGVAWYRDYRTIHAASVGTFSISTHTTGVWSGNSSGGTYRLSFDGQVTIRPTRLDVSVTAPSGMRIVWTSQPMTVDGGTASWRGTPGATLTLEIRFRAPLPVRVVRDLTRPVFGG